MVFRSLKRLAQRIVSRESGQVLPAVLAMLAVGGLIVVPSLNYITTNLKAGKAVETRTRALYTAESGVRDAMWQLRYSSVSTPYSYTLSGINNMSVDVTIDAVTMIAGEVIGPTGVHGGWLKLEKSVSYAAGQYTLDITMTNNGDGNMRIEEILVEFPVGLAYVVGSTTGPITTADPSVVGTPQVGITTIWEIPSPYFTIGKNDSVTHSFRLSGPAGIQGVEGHSVVKATREDVGTVWDADSRPYSITAQAKDSEGSVLSTIDVGVWKGTTKIEIGCWQISP